MTTSTHPPDVLAVRARQAPDGPGVYVLLGRDDELLYVGKAAGLRRRLLDHAKTRALAARVQDVRWIECADEVAALCLEADVIVGLAPVLNKSMAHEEYTYVCLDIEEKGIRLRSLVNPAAGARVYGAFPHLGKGKASWRAVRTNGGYSALLRLLWIASATDRMPARLRGTSPPIDHRMPFDRAFMPHLHDFLSGRSIRLMKVLRAAVSRADAYMRGALVRDAEAAELFYRLGPRALRDLRRAHGLRIPVDPETFARAVSADLKAAIGPFTSTRAMMGTA